MSWIAALLRRFAAPPPLALETARLRLQPATAAMLHAELSDRLKLGDLLDADVPASWPPEGWDEPLLSVEALCLGPGTSGVSPHYYVALRAAGRADAGSRDTLVGVVGVFARAGGEVELAYSTLPAHQGQGYATEAARAVVGQLLEAGGVHAVSAQAPAGRHASIKVMERCGMLPAGEGDEPGTLRYRRI